MVTVFVPFRSIVGRTLYELYFPYFSPKVLVTRKVRRPFVTLIEVYMRLTECIPGDNNNKIIIIIIIIILYFLKTHVTQVSMLFTIQVKT